MRIEGRGEWRIQLIHKLDQNKKRITLQTEDEKQKSVSTADRNVEHDDYDSRRRTNYGDDRRIMLEGG